MSHYPFQARALERWAALPSPRRLILGWPMGSGKTRVGLEATREYEQVLVVAPALGMGPWLQQCEKWLGERAGLYDKSLHRKVLSKKDRARLQDALTRRVLVTTPHFAFGELASWPRERACLLLDEGHMFANPFAGRSDALREFLKPSMAVLMFTGTLFPKEIRDVWNPVQSLFPGIFPLPATKTGGVPFSFLRQFAKRSELGFFYGSRPDRLHVLRQLLDTVADIVSEQEALAHVPPLQIHALAGDRKTPQRWIDEQDGVRSTVMIAWTRARAEEYAAMMRAAAGTRVVECLHGSTPATQRFERLEELKSVYRNDARVGLACTADAFQESLSLAWFERGLLSDWRRSPRQVLQLLGRFRRPDDAKRVPSVLDLLVEDGQAAAAQTAIERLSAFQQLLGPSANADAFVGALTAGTTAQASLPVSADDIREMFNTGLFEGESDIANSWFTDDEQILTE